jgi:hypothetical protein
MIRLLFAPLAAAIVAVGEVAYLVCLAVGALWPSIFGMQAFFATIFPGFTWLDPFGFVLGLVEVALYGLAAAAVATVAWNFVADRTAKAGA